VPDLVSSRAATEADVARTAELAELEQQRIRSERGGRWHLDHDQEQLSPTSRHQRALEASDRCLVVGCIDGTPVGYASAFLSPGGESVLCMIDELIVHPDAQSIGVGSEILALVRGWAVEHGCAAIESQVLPGNRAAKNFFERVGMKTRKMRVSADL